VRAIVVSSPSVCGNTWWETLEPRRLLSTPYVIDGVQPAALDQPQIHAFFRRTANGTPLIASDPILGDTFDVQAFLDTGTSGMLLSQETAQGLGIASSTYNGTPVDFADIGVGGAEHFDVSEPLYTALSWFPGTDYDNINTYQTVYNQKYGPLRTEINQTPADELVGPLDIIGMPVLQGKVMVMDPTPVENLDYIHTFVYDPGTPYNAANRAENPGIPNVSRHVKLSYGDFSRFTLTTPSGAPGPTLVANPFIGPDPTLSLQANPLPDHTPPVVLQQGNLTSTGSFLFDTGAAASFISRAEALELGIHYKPGTYNSQDPNINPDLQDAGGHDLPNQFIIPLGGIGGQLNVAGFFMDSLTLPTIEGQPITFTHAPVLVADITAQDPNTGDTLTLDGDFGMNFLVASADISSGFPTNTTAGAFNFVTFDQPNGLLGLDLTDAPNLPPVVSDAYLHDDTLPQTLTFTFSRDVAGVTPAAFVVKNTATGATITPTSVTYDSNTHTATLTFSSSESVFDGHYTATVSAAAITDAVTGAHLDGNADGTATGTAADNYTYNFTHLVGDANRDGKVDFFDIAVLLGTRYNAGGSGATWSQGDLNYDGHVDFFDLSEVLSEYYNAPPPATAAAPAPTTAPTTAPTAAATASPSALAQPAVAQPATVASPFALELAPLTASPLPLLNARRKHVWFDL
jgi:hypothetical protein